MASSTILVVDDDIVVLAALSKMLNLFGYIVAGASNSQAAMDYVANSRRRFDLIITDLAMPGIDGVEFTATAKKVFPDVPVIVMTGHSELCTPEEAIRLGAFAFLPKPFNMPEVISTIERAIPAAAPRSHRPRPPTVAYSPASPYASRPAASALTS